jgi:dolichol-phosphate mannosyltransferase
LTSTPVYSFVVPVLDEQDGLDELYRRLVPVMDAMDGPCEVVLVDDGSTDDSFDVMVKLHARDERFNVLRLSRNFGHQIAITAGLEYARGDAAIIMDADLQDPPEVALEMAKKWREGFDVVYAVRDSRAGESRAKVASARWFYRLLGRMSEVPLPVDAGDFRLVDRRALDPVLAMREHRRYMRGMFAWVGYDQTAVHYVRDARHTGATKYPLGKMLRFGADGIVSFSAAPLRVALTVGFSVSVASFALGLLTIILKLAGVEHVVPGWASIAVALTFLGGIQLTMLGVMGEYIARIYEEVKQRPLYLVREWHGRDAAPRTDRGYRARPADTTPPHG